MRRMSYERRKAWAGRAFISLWIVGIATFFLWPMAQSFYLTLQDMTFTAGGMALEPVGFLNYENAFLKDAYMLGYLWDSVSNVFSSMPLIMLFSLFAAVLLNKRFKGRGFVRSVFFLPVIITSGALIYVLKTETTTVQNAYGASVMLKNTALQRFIISALRNERIARTMVSMFDNVFVIIWKSGVQTLLFLAGLQAIPTSLYECATVEGASGWEMFWKITVPMVSPVLIINVVYTMVDSFTDYSNSLLRYAVTCTYGNIQYTYGTTIAWIYFLITFMVLMALMGIITRRIFYIND